MNDKLAKITKAGQSALRIVKAVGPFLISQSKEMSESFAEHQLRLSKADAAKSFILNEVNSLSNIRNSLREKFYAANIEDRFRFKKDLEETEREIRRLNIISSAMDQLPPPQDNVDKPETEQKSVSLHWMDKFNEFARANNEDWRKELLTKALALEAQAPGVIGPRALWIIGTIDEYLFHAYASLLDISTTVTGSHLIPNHQQFNEKSIPNCILGSDHTIGNLVFMLSDLGLIGDTLSSEKQFSEKGQLIVVYNKKVTLLKMKQKLSVRGIIPTVLGEAIAKLYTSKPNELGVEIYSKWLDSINDTIAEKNILT